MYDRFNRRINYLRISVTDRCNLRCMYCMPEEGVRLIPREDILSFEEIFQVTETAVRMGIDKVRITGGEPLVRRNIVDLISMLAGIRGIRDFALTTNGILLDEFAGPLARAGLQRINISLDAVNPARYSELTRGGEVNRVLSGIRAAKSAGFLSIKLNCVVHKSSEEPDAKQVAEYAKENGLVIRFIRRMNLATGEFWEVESGSGGNCPQCNRLRLSSDGLLKPCLFSDLSFSVRSLGVEKAIRQAVEAKPPAGKSSRTNHFYSIGG